MRCVASEEDPLPYLYEGDHPISELTLIQVLL